MANDLVPVEQKGEMTQNLKESLMLRGDLSLLKPEERVAYYQAVCDRVGIDPLTQPFALITLDGKLKLYATKDCTEQLRKNHKISIEVVSIKEDFEARTVTAIVKATDPDGRSDMDVGSATLTPEGKAQVWEEFKDEAGKVQKRKAYPLILGSDRANAQKKAVTQAKRRVTLSICGLGALDESELESMDQKRLVPDKPIEAGTADKVLALKEELKLSADQFQAHLSRYGVEPPGGVASLTQRQAEELIVFLDKVKSIQS